VRQEALARLPAFSVADIARTHADPEVRIDAVMGLNDVKLLAEIAARDASSAVREAALISAKGDSARDLKLDGFDCKRAGSYEAKCVARLVNSGAVAYTDVEYKMGGLAYGTFGAPARIPGRIEAGQTREVDIQSSVSQSAGTVEIRLVGARKARPESGPPPAQTSPAVATVARPVPALAPSPAAAAQPPSGPAYYISTSAAGAYHYHREGCSLLAGGAQRIQASDLGERRPCALCKPPAPANERD
jgi:hypothetical protein